MPSRTSAASPPTPIVEEITGRAFRRYRVRDTAEVDACLRGLKVWLCEAIERSPSLTRRHIERYTWDIDRLLDVRSRIMQRDAGS